MITSINALITSTAETQNTSTNCVLNDSQYQYSPPLKPYPMNLPSATHTLEGLHYMTTLEILVSLTKNTIIFNLKL
jgi:hypothetical protein